MELVAGYFDMFVMYRGRQQDREVAQRHQDVFQYGTAVDGRGIRFVGDEPL